MADKTVVVEIQYDTDSAIKNLNKLTDEIVENENQQKALKDAYKNGTVTQEQYSQAMEDTRKEISEGKKERKTLLDQLKSEEGSVDRLKADIKNLTGQRNKLNQKTKEGKEQAQQYNARLKDMKGALKEAQSGTKEAGNAFGRLKDDLAALPHPIGGVVSGIGGMTKAALKFVATPLGAIITAIVVVAQQMIKAFQRSEKRMVALRAIGAKLSGVFQGFQKVLEPLVDFIFENVIVAFEKLSIVADKAVSLISKGLRGLGLDKAADNVDNFINKIEETSRAAGELAEMEGKLTEELRRQDRVQLEFQKRAEQLRQIRDDESKMIGARIKANRQLGEVLQEQFGEEMSIARLALDVANKRIEVEGETTAALDARAEAMLKIAEIEERIVSQGSEQLVNINSLLRERADLEKQRLDFVKETEKGLDDFLEKEMETYDFRLVSEQEFNEAVTNFHTQRLDQINAEREARIMAEKEAMMAAIESIAIITNAAGMMKDERIAIQGELLSRAIAFNNMEEASEIDKFAAFADIASTFTGFMTGIYDKQLSDLNKEKQAELALTGDNVEAKEAIELEYAKREQEIKKKQFDADKKKAIVDTLIQTAVAVVKSLTNIPLSVAIGALGLIQTNAIRKREFEPETFARGGKLALFGGRSHSAGGTHLYGSDGSHLEVERGEAAFVLKKDATAEIAALSAINESFGGRSMATRAGHMQEGGQADMDRPPTLTASELADAFSRVTIVTRVDDIKTGMSRFEKVVNNGVV